MRDVRKLAYVELTRGREEVEEEGRRRVGWDCECECEGGGEVAFLYPRVACEWGSARSVLRSVVSLVRGRVRGWRREGRISEDLV